MNAVWAYTALLFVSLTFGGSYANSRREVRDVDRADIRRGDVAMEARRRDILRESTTRRDMEQIRRYANIDEMQRRLDKRLYEDSRTDYRDFRHDGNRDSRRDDIRDERRRQSRQEISIRRMATFNDNDFEISQSDPSNMKFGVSIAMVALLLFQIFAWKSSDAKLE